jgi:hypothetical protein
LLQERIGKVNQWRTPTAENEELLVKLNTIATYELKVEIEARQQQMVEAKKNGRGNAIKKVKCLCKDFSFTAEMFQGSLAEGRKKQ